MSLTRLWLTLTLATVAVEIRADVTIKRIPSGFMGMRGKKSIDFSGLEDFEPDNYPYSNLLENTYMEPQYYEHPRSDLFYGYDQKRAPMGFQGMRGKKNLMDGLYDDEYEKRAVMGFQGMRGKREYEDKRGPMGFQGMRGKKDGLSDEYIHAFDSNEQTTNKPDKSSEITEQIDNGLDQIVGLKQRRAANMGFFGVRGKKMPSNGFFGMRGKKGPFDYPFRGKFVGVRGKKFDERPDSIRYLMDGLVAGEDGYEKRKGPSGFLGMRGKKWVAPEIQTNTGPEE